MVQAFSEGNRFACKLSQAIGLRQLFALVSAVACIAAVCFVCAALSPQTALAANQTATLSDASSTAYSRSVKAVRAYASKDYSHAAYEKSPSGTTIVKVDISDLHLSASAREKVRDRLLYNTDYWYLQLSANDSTSKQLIYRLAYTDSSIPSRQKKLNAAVAKAKTWIAGCKSDAQVIHMLNDWMVKNVSYDYDDKNHSVTRKLPYRCLVEGKADCNGYAYGMDYLMRKCGYSTAFAFNTKIDHIWNMVKLGSHWYHVDVTWDKSLSYKSYWKGAICHRWLLLSDRGMKFDEHKGWTCVRNGIVASVKATDERYDSYMNSDWTKNCRKALGKGSTFTYGNCTYKVTAKGKSVQALKAKSRSKTSYTVPSVVWHRGYCYRVTSIGSGAFKGCSKAKSFVIGSNVYGIGGSAFSSCSKLKTITLKSAHLTKSKVKGCLKSSKVSKVKLSGTAAKSKKSYYKKIFAKSNTGRKAKVY